MTKPGESLYIFATIRPKPEYVEEALKALEAIVQQTIAESGCHLFTVLRDRGDPGVLNLFESFDNDEAVKRHYDQPYTKAVFEKYRDWLAEPVGIKHLKLTSSVSAGQFS